MTYGIYIRTHVKQRWCSHNFPRVSMVACEVRFINIKSCMYSGNNKWNMIQWYIPAFPKSHFIQKFLGYDTLPFSGNNFINTVDWNLKFPNILPFNIHIWSIFCCKLILLGHIFTLVYWRVGCCCCEGSYSIENIIQICPVVVVKIPVDTRTPNWDFQLGQNLLANYFIF